MTIISTQDWDKIQQYALDAGFADITITPLTIPAAQQQEFEAFLADNRHGTMAWLGRHTDRRKNPKSLMDNANSAIILGFNYAPDYDPLLPLQYADKGVISCYAQGDDYHDIIKKKLIIMARHLHEQYKADCRVFVDTAPLLEKVLAANSHLGWQGKHTNLVSKKFGSWLFLGVIVTSIQQDGLPSSKPHHHCGSCTQCIDICPTNAFDAPYRIDARKCISYLTIEHQGLIDPIYYKAIGNRIYGCDDCLAICPWNKFAQSAHELRLKPRARLVEQTLKTYLCFDEAQFRAFFSKSPIKRITHTRFIRNCLIAASNDTANNYTNYFHKWANDDNDIIAQTARLVMAH